MADNIKIYLIGNAHLDPVWLWRWPEGFAEIKATFRSALDRMEEFPEFIFTSASAAYYQWVEENCPEMFAEIQKRVQEGRWVIAGGWWVQPDCNIPSGESFARHSLYSQRYFLEKFGVTAKVGYNVDSFGHHGMIPQILKKSGIDYYVFMRPFKEENPAIPGPLFWWESQDGSRVLTFQIMNRAGYGSQPPGDVTTEHQKIIESIGIAKEKGIPLMNFYGIGNHGGGPTIANLNLIRKLQAEPEGNCLIISSPNQYFEDMVKNSASLPVYEADLQHHAIGCYSTTSEIKASNRKLENRLLFAEEFSAIAHILSGLEYPGDKLRQAWENVMFNQFHDIMGGCCIQEAIGDATEWYGESAGISSKILNAALQKISWAVDTMGIDKKLRSKEKDLYLWEVEDKGVPVVVYNPLSWEVNVPVQVNRKLNGITDHEGDPVELQIVRGSQTNEGDKWNSVFLAAVPAMGYRVYWMYLTKVFQIPEPKKMLKAEQYLLENDFIRLEIEPHTGYIKKLYDKVHDINVLSHRGAVPIVLDIYKWDTWGHNVYEFRDETARFGNATVKLLENGPLRAKLRVESSYNQSVLRQDFILYRDRKDVEVRVKLDWRERHKLLKLSFPVNVEQPKAVYEIPYGFIVRPVNGEEEPGQQWIDVTGLIDGKEFGMALLNDSKYSFDVKGGEMRMTVANGSIYADHHAKENRDDLCEYMDQGIQEFKYVLLPHAENWRGAGVVQAACELNTSFSHVIETYHQGLLPQIFQGIKISNDNIMSTVFKKAEDGNGYILRCYETAGKETDTTIEIPVLHRKWTACFGKCEIKTFRLPEDYHHPVYENNLVEV